MSKKKARNSASGQIAPSTGYPVHFPGYFLAPGQNALYTARYPGYQLAPGQSAPSTAHFPGYQLAPGQSAPSTAHFPGYQLAPGQSAPSTAHYPGYQLAPGQSAPSTAHYPGYPLAPGQSGSFIAHYPGYSFGPGQSALYTGYANQTGGEHLRIVLVGKTGVGKSAAGNTIMGREAFKSEINSSSVTSDCSKESGVVNGKQLAVVDTPGLFDTKKSNDEIVKKIVECISYSSPGPHVFLVVLQLGRFTKEEQDTVEIIQTTFGSESAKYTMVLFTHGDRLKKKSIEDFLSPSTDLLGLIDQCRGGYHVFNNEDTNNHSQVSDLLKKIDKMVARNGGGCYTNEMYRRTETFIEEEKKRILKEEKHQEEDEELRLILARQSAERAAATAAQLQDVKNSKKCTIQ